MIKNEPSKNLPKVGVIIGGGGIKPYGSVHLFKMLEELEIPISVIGAISGGSQVSGLYAMGYPCDEVKAILTSEFEKGAWTVTNYRFFLGLLNLKQMPFSPQHGIFKKEDCLSVIRSHVGDAQIEDTQIPLVISATNFETGKTEYFTKGPLVECVYASSALLPLFPPIQIGKKTYIDGGFSLGDPFSYLVKMDLDLIIAVSFFDTTSEKNISNFLSMSNFLTKSFHLCFNTTQRLMTVLVHEIDTIFIPVQFDRNVEVWSKDLLNVVFETNEIELEKYRQQIQSVYNGLKELKSNQPNK